MDSYNVGRAEVIAWEWLAIVFDATAAIVFLFVGWSVRQWTLLGAGLVLLATIGLMVAATVSARQDLASLGYFIGWGACATGAFLLWHMANSTNNR